MKQLIIATHNQGKLKEFKAALEPLGYLVDSAASLNITAPEETGLSFIENAILKARHVANHCEHPVLADDSGLVVPALNGQPGIYSARYGGKNADDEQNRQTLLEKMTNIDDRQAFFYCALALVTNPQDPTPMIATGSWHGTITNQAKGSEGFGYDPIFQIENSDLTAAELSTEDKQTLSHRGQALKALLKTIKY